MITGIIPPSFQEDFWNGIGNIAQSSVEEVDRKELRSKLAERLKRRVEWTVYFEANVDASYMDAVYAMDVIQGSGAKLIWVTPKVREQWRNKPESSPNN